MIQRDRCFAKAVRPPRHTARLLRSRRHIAAIFPLAVGIVLLAQVGVATAASGRVAVFPVPGSEYNRSQTQITFRGAPASQLGSVRVVSSQTGVHSGHIAGDADGQGGSFLPDQPFAAGETVTVTTDLSVLGSGSGTFSFQIAQPWGLLPYGKLPLVSPGRNGVQHSRSRPDLQPAAATVTENHAPESEGDIFVAPQFGPRQDGPMILDPQGNLVWFDPFPVSQNTLVTDFRVQQPSRPARTHLVAGEHQLGPRPRRGRDPQPRLPADRDGQGWQRGWTWACTSSW